MLIKDNIESLAEKEDRLEKMISEFNILKAEYEKRELHINLEIERLEKELEVLESKKNDSSIQTQINLINLEENIPLIPDTLNEDNAETSVKEQIQTENFEIRQIKNEIDEMLNKNDLPLVSEIINEDEIDSTTKEEKVGLISKASQKIGLVLSNLNDRFSKFINKKNKGLETLISNEPKSIKIKDVIMENVSIPEMKEIQKEIPDQDIEKLIKDGVIEQINKKEITTIKDKKIESKLKRAIRKTRNYLLMILVSATTFETTTFSTTRDRDDVLSYDNIRVDDLSDWEKVKLYEDEMNNLDNISLITQFNENSDDKYIIIDKQNGKAHQYQGDNLLRSYNVCLGDSTGDDQTQLKSIYRKKFDGSDRAFHRNPSVSLNEATYVENGERYLRDGYEAFTDWGTGNMQTGAGIYSVSNKGPFQDDYGIFLKNERGFQVATSLHVNKKIKTKAPDFRFTNGCVGFSKKDLLELYQTVSNDEKVYILPDNPRNKFKIIDGELRFISNEQNVNRTIRPYESKPVILHAENPTENAKIWLMTISENKSKLMSLYPTIPNGVYNELAKISYGIMGKESTFGTYGGPRGQYGRVRDTGAAIVGLEPSVGPGQVKIENIEPKIIKAFNIRSNNDLFDVQINAIATMSILLDNYIYVVKHGKEKDYKKITILKYNASKEAARIVRGSKKIEELGPITKGYIKKVLNYAESVKVYTKDAGDNYFNPNWDYGNPNDLAMNN